MPKRICAAIIIVVALLLLFEIWARFFAASHWRADPFYEMNRNEKNFSILGDLEKIPKTKHGVRIVVTGGSVAYGWGASDSAHRFPSILEQQLKRKWHRDDVEVINGGVPDFTASDELVLYMEKLQSLSPDLVVMFTGFNDMWDTLKYSLIKHSAPRLAHTFDHRVIQPTQTWELFVAFLRSFGIRMNGILSRWSKGYVWMRDQWDHMRYQPILNLSSFQQDSACDSLQEFSDALLAMNALTTSHQQRLLVVIQPVRFLTNVPQAEFPISRYERVLEKIYHACVATRLQNLTVSYGVKILNSNPALSSQLVRAHRFIDFCHVDDEGNEMIAEWMAGEISSAFNRDGLASLAVVDHKIKGGDHRK